MLVQGRGGLSRSEGPNCRGCSSSKSTPSTATGSELVASRVFTAPVEYASQDQQADKWAPVSCPAVACVRAHAGCTTETPWETTKAWITVSELERETVPNTRVPLATSDPSSDREDQCKAGNSHRPFFTGPPETPMQKMQGHLSGLQCSLDIA